MTIIEYNEIVKKVNSDSLERSIFTEIEGYCRDRGMEVFQLDYNKYLQMRNYLIKINKDGLVNRLESGTVSNQSKKRKFRIDWGVVSTLVISGIVFLIAFNVPAFSLPGIGIGICILAWGLKDVIPYSSGSSDYVDRVIKAHEDARINTRAYLHQAYIHSGEIKILKDKINGK